MEAGRVWSFQRLPAKTWWMHKLTHRGETLQSKSLQCYNYSSFFLLDKHKGGFLSHSLLTSSFSLSSPLLTAQLGELALIAPKSRGSTTSASHPGIIVSAGVGGLEKKEGFAAYGEGFVECLGSRKKKTWHDGALWWTDGGRKVKCHIFCLHIICQDYKRFRTNPFS